MKNTLLTGSAIGMVVASLAIAAPAAAQSTPVGTQVGETIRNTVTVNYTVGGVAQDPETDDDIVALDRKVDLTLVRLDNTATQVSPGAQNQAVSFQLTNLSNDVLDFALDADNIANGTASELTPGENDNFDVNGGFTYYLDNGDGIFNAADDTVITYVDNLASGDSRIIHVVSNIQTGLTNNDRAAIELTATARASGQTLTYNATTFQYDVTATGAGTLGGVLTQAGANSADPLAIDTVFADTDANGQIARDGAAFDTDDYLVFTAGIIAAKSSRIVASPIPGDTSGTNIPGATIEYCILVTNAVGGADAQAVTITDVLPGEVTYESAYGVRVGGADCATPGPNTGTETGGTVTGTIGTVPAGQSRSVIFRALID